MPAHPDVVPGLEQLLADGYRLLTLTNSPSRPGLASPLDNAGLDELDRHAQSGDACTDDRDAGCPDGHRHLEVARSRRRMIIVG
jgi:2-haloacid dehalogenase